jgi:hypothetical protein
MAAVVAGVSTAAEWADFTAGAAVSTGVDLADFTVTSRVTTALAKGMRVFAIGAGCSSAA